MPVTPSAKKALRNAQAKRLRNLVHKLALKKALKQASPDSAPQVVSLLDKSAKRGLIHANKAARLKSQLAKRLASGLAAEAPKPKKSTKSKGAVKSAKAKAPVKRVAKVTKKTPKA